MITLDQAVKDAEVLTDNLSAIAAQNQTANRSAILDVSSVEQLADSSLSSLQAQGQLNNFVSITTSSTTTTTSSSSTTELTLAAAQTSAAQQNSRTFNSGSCCCLAVEETQPQVLNVTLEDVGIRYGFDAFNNWENENYAFVIGRVSINIPLGGSFFVLMDFGGDPFEVEIPSPLKTGGDSPYSLGTWFSISADVDDPWPPPYHQVFAKGTSLSQFLFCESKTLSVTGYRLGSNPFDIFESRVSNVQLPNPVALEICPYIGTVSLQESQSDQEITATVSVDNLPFIFPLRIGVAYGDTRWRADYDPSGTVNWIWEEGGTPPEEPILALIDIDASPFRYFDQFGNPTNTSSTVFWAWDVFSKQYQLQVILLDWRWNGQWEYVGPRWSNYYTNVTFWEEDFVPDPPYSGPPTYVFPEPESATDTLTIPEGFIGSTYVAFAVNGGYSSVVLPERPAATLISWTFEAGGNAPPFGWSLSGGGDTSIVRFEVEDSSDCGGSNASVQSGKARGTINITGQSRLLSIGIEGIGELEDTGFEATVVLIDGTPVMDAQSRGGGQGCTMGPVRVDAIVPGPYLLEPGTHEILVDFSTGDPLFHVGVFSEVTFQLS